MHFRLLAVFLFLSCPVFAQNDKETRCRFYAYNDESIFLKKDSNQMEITFNIDHPVGDSIIYKAPVIISRKKGIHSFNINSIGDDETQVSLTVSNLFDVHYLRIILERNLKIKYIRLNDTDISWEEFEKKFLPASNSQKQ